MGIREDLIKAIQAMDEDDVAAVWEYVQLLREPEEVESTGEERAALARGRDEYARGEFQRLSDIKRRVKA